MKYIQAVSHLRLASRADSTAGLKLGRAEAL